MELHEIKGLIEKYLEAETTIAEEKMLAEYFNSNEVDAELESYRDMFGYFGSQREVESQRSFASQQPKRRRRTWIPAAAAAVVLFGIGIYGWQMGQQPQKSELGSFDDPEVALRETRKALNMLSEKVNTGVSSVSYLNEYEQSKNVIFKN